MRSRQHELSHFDTAITWVDEDVARQIYSDGRTFDHPTAYGLNPTTVRVRDRHVVTDLSVATDWLHRQIGQPVSHVFVVFGEHDVFRTSTDFFLAEWPNLFCPGRDDALVIEQYSRWIMFYDHEDELEIGVPQRPALITTLFT